MNNNVKIYSESMTFVNICQFYFLKELFIATLFDILSLLYFQIKVFSILYGIFCLEIFEIHKIFNKLFPCYSAEMKREENFLKAHIYALLKKSFF